MSSQKVAYTGIPGAHSEIALLKMFESQPSFMKSKVSPTSFTSFDQVCAAVASSEIGLGFIPVENSIIGTFHDVLELIEKHQLYIVGEYEREEHHLLLGLPNVNLSEITEIHSHPYVFEQCRDALAELADKKFVQTKSTASTCALIQEKQLRNVAAIASSRAAQLYGLQELRQLNVTAVTRYVLISKTEAVVERHENPRTSLKIVLRNQVGALVKAAACFAHRDINISKLESKPLAKSIQSYKPWEYIIFIDVDAGLTDLRLTNAIKNLEEFGKVTVLGSFPRFLAESQPVAFSYGQ